MLTSLLAPSCTTESWSNKSWLLTDIRERLGVGLSNSLLMSGSSLMEALILGDNKVALIFGISDPVLIAAASISLLKGEPRLGPPLFGRVRSDVAVLIPVWTPDDPLSR